MTITTKMHALIDKLRLPCIPKKLKAPQVPVDQQAKHAVEQTDQFERSSTQQFRFIRRTRTLPLISDIDLKILVEKKLAGLDGSSDAQRIKSMLKTSDGFLKPRPDERFIATPNEEFNRTRASHCISTGIPPLVNPYVSQDSVHLAVMHAEAALCFNFESAENRKIWALTAVLEDLFTQKYCQV